MNLLIEGNEFIGDPPAPAKTWGEYFENVFVTSLLSGLRVSALAEDRVADIGKTSDHFADAGKMVATIRPEVTVEPVAWATVGFVTWGNRQIEKVDKLTREAQPEYGFVIPLYTAPPKREPLTEQELEPIRRRMMMEAYNAADDGDSERYNALKVMANDVLDMLLGGEE